MSNPQSYPPFLTLTSIFSAQLQTLSELREVSNYYFQQPVSPNLHNHLINSPISHQLNLLTANFQNLIQELSKIFPFPGQDKDIYWIGVSDQNEPHVTTQAPSIVSGGEPTSLLPIIPQGFMLPNIMGLPPLQFTNETPNIIHRQKTQKTTNGNKQITETTQPKRKKGRNSETKKNLICEHCQTGQTPEWRTGPNGPKTLCNRCGLRYAKLTKREALNKTQTTMLNDNTEDIQNSNDTKQENNNNEEETKETDKELFKETEASSFDFKT